MKISFYGLNNPSRGQEYVELRQMLLVVPDGELLPFISYLCTGI